MNSFNSDMDKSEYFLEGESEEKSLSNIQDRIGDVIHEGRIPSKRRYGIFGILLIVLVSLLYFLFQPEGVEDSSKLAQEHYAHFLNYENFQTRGNNQNTDLKRAYELYDIKNYLEASMLFSNSIDKLNNADRFYYALSLMGEHKWELGLMQLNTADLSGLPQYQNAAAFYTALAEFNNGDIKEAKRKLKILANGNSQFNQASSALLDEILSAPGYKSNKGE